MGSENDGDVGGSPSWSSTVNWTVVGGSLENSVAYESFYSPINEEDVADSSPKSPLVLRLPSAESCPCEINVRFAEKHEIRQVYVRSTARVYEMYYATNSQKENEYLCTVRCGAARREEEMLYTTGIGVSAHMNGPNGDVAEGNLKSGGNLNSNEDDWVDVKVPDTPAPDHKKSSPSISSADSVRIRQNFYEATAEITDANPCTSLTIRLLSLQNKSLVYVDEIYVFANPVDSEEEGPVENSAQSSMMSMLVPTLLHFSKTTGSNKKDDGRTSNAEGINILPKIGSKAFDTTNNLTGAQHEGKPCATDCGKVKLRETNESDRAVDQSEAHLQVPIKESKHDEPLHRIESILNQLVSRMDRIENCFLRFEENMLNPINSIEGRLKQVEQQLEVLTKELHGSELPSCYRMSAPNFSGNESGSNSFYNSGNDHPSCGPIEPDRKELHSGASSTALEDPSYSVSSSLLHPSLVVTAPEFSNGGDDDDEENQALEVAMDSLTSKPKPLIDNVLASALARFASSYSTKTPECTETVAVRSPELLNEEDGNNDSRVLSTALSEIETDHLSCSEETDDTECTKNSASASLSSTDSENLSSSSDDLSVKNAEEDEEVLKGLECEYQSADDGIGVALAEPSVEPIKEVRKVEVINETSDDLVSKRSDVPIHPLDYQTENGPDTTEVDVTVVTKEGCGIDIVHDVLGFSRDASVVNFQIPILDVSFTPIADTSSEHTLKDLLGDMPELNYEAPCLKESDDSTPISKQFDLILVEEEGRVDPNPTNGHLSVDMNYYSIMDEPLIADGENLQDYCPCGNHNTIISSLI